MNPADVWPVIIGLGIASALIRYSFLGLLRGRKVPQSAQRALSLVPVAAFPAIFAPMLFLDGEGGWAALSFPLAALAALVIGAVTRSMVFSLIAGAAAIAALQAAGL
ncbi:MAG: AzlD domain-containing protein [Pseudomonadota bacterium]